MVDEAAKISFFLFSTANHDVTAKILHLQLCAFAAKHEVGMVKSPLHMFPVFSDVVWALSTFVCHDIYPGHLLPHFINFERWIVQQYWEVVLSLTAVEKAARNLPDKFLRLKISEYLQSCKKKNNPETSDNSTKLWGRVIGSKQPSLWELV